MRRYSAVDYDKLDPVKKLALDTFFSTLNHTKRLGIQVMPTGGTAAVLDFLDYDFMLAFNVEGLGTKNLIADAMYDLLRKNPELEKYLKDKRIYKNIGQCTAAMSLTDLCAVGADPIVYGDFLTAGSSDWFDDEERNVQLLEGYKKAADLAECAVPCGETPVLENIINPETLVLEGASVGLIKPKERFSYGQKIRDGDKIYGLPSNGLCANGISKAREIAGKLKYEYFTKLADNRTLGEHILDPTPVYVKPIIEMFDEADLHYATPITGHGWEKFMRAPFSFTYEIENLPDVPEVMKYLIEASKELGFPMDNKTNYFVWNMGVFIGLIAPKDSEKIMKGIAEKYDTKLYELGTVRQGKRRVEIKPIEVIFE